MMRARLHRWWHCLTGMFSGHQAVTLYGRQTIFGSKVTALTCTCGKVFWP